MEVESTLWALPTTTSTTWITMKPAKAASTTRVRAQSIEQEGIATAKGMRINEKPYSRRPRIFA
jgi:hypothetical protein